MTYLIAIFVGAVIGGASGGGFGVIVGAALGWLLLRVLRQQAEIAALRRSFEALGAEKAAEAPAPAVWPFAADAAGSASPAAAAEALAPAALAPAIAVAMLPATPAAPVMR
ncbi:MAG: hypothetical protein ACXWKD_19205, partial [Caldimonas sp.]